MHDAVCIVISQCMPFNTAALLFIKRKAAECRLVATVPICCWMHDMGLRIMPRQVCREGGSCNIWGWQWLSR